MLRPPPFPTSPDELTADLVGEAIGATVTSIDTTVIGADRGMVGQILLIHPTSSEGVELPPLIAKFAGQRDGGRASSRRSGMHLRELNFYDQLAPRTDVRVPHVHGAWYDEETDAFLLIQDAVDADPDVDQIAGIGPARVVATARQIAACHATWWESPELLGMNWLPRLDGVERRTNLATIMRAGWEPLVEMIEPELDADEIRLGDGLPEVLDARMREVASTPQTLIHSDLRADNLLFTPGGDEVTIIDWQGCGLGAGAWDLAYLLSQSLTVADRRHHERALLDGYLDELRARGVDQDRREFEQTYAQSLVFGLVVATSLPVIGDRTERRVRRLAASMARRSIEAMRDHDVLW